MSALCPVCHATHPGTTPCPLRPGPAADDVPALLAEAAAFCAAPLTTALRAGIVADLANALDEAASQHRYSMQVSRDLCADVFRLTDELARVTAERDRLARHLAAIVAIGQRVRPRAGLCGKATPSANANADESQINREEAWR